MGNRRFEFKQKLLILRVISGFLYFWACEPVYRFFGFPEREQEEVRHIPLDPAQ